MNWLVMRVNLYLQELIEREKGQRTRFAAVYRSRARQRNDKWIRQFIDSEQHLIIMDKLRTPKEL